MYINKLLIRNVRSFADSGEISLSKGINILIGANNSGKSVIIKSLYELQKRDLLKTGDIRVGEQDGEVIIYLDDIETGYILPHSRDTFAPQGIHRPEIHITRARSEGTADGSNWHIRIPQNPSPDNWSDLNSVPEEEPKNFIYPYLSKRKVVEFTQSVNKSLTVQVPDNLSNLVAKIDRISDTNFPSNQEFRDICDKVLGFQVSAFQSDQGKQAGIRVTASDDIPLEAMGEGVSSLLGLITSLCLAENKLFLIEEIENDIHPKALKSLLELIISKSENNQFVVSTHSNIVTKMLGSATESKLHKVGMTFENRVPTSTYSPVDSTPDQRRKVLEELGYEMIDFDLWEGWLFLEESSAEKIIRAHLIKWFAPKLIGKLRTISCYGVDSVSPRFEDFDRLFLFTHLEPAYKDKAWVLVDGDERGKEVIEKLKEDYPSWTPDRFNFLHEESFEKYYPSAFNSDVEAVLQMSHGEQKQNAKTALLNKVVSWIEEDENRAKEEFSSTAEVVIKILQRIEQTLIS